MLCIPRQLRPSSLVWAAELSEPAQALYEQSLDCTRTTDPRLMEWLIEEVNELRRNGNRHDCGIVHLCLADRYHELGKLGPALKCCEMAETHLCSWPGIADQHNHAVALYALGLIQQCLGLEREALASYAKALQEFNHVRAQWLAWHEPRWMEQCSQVSDWIVQLQHSINESRVQGRTATLHCSLMVEFWPSNPDSFDGVLPFLEATTEQTVTNMNLHLEDQIYELESPWAQEIKLEPCASYRVVGSQHVQDIPPEYRDAKYVLVRVDEIQARRFWNQGQMDTSQVRFVGEESNVVGVFKKAA